MSDTHNYSHTLIPLNTFKDIKHLGTLNVIEVPYSFYSVKLDCRFTGDCANYQKLPWYTDEFTYIDVSLLWAAHLVVMNIFWQFRVIPSYAIANIKFCSPARFSWEDLVDESCASVWEAEGQAKTMPW